MAVPNSAEFVVIGGGAVGCAVAYALAQSGRTDIVVLERRPHTAMGTSSQGAGLCGQVRTSVERVQLAMYSARTFDQLERAASPVKPGWRPVGSMRLALNEQRVAECQRLAAVCAAAGLEVELIDVGTARHRWPKLSFRGVLAVLWCPSDGYLSPIDVVRTYEHHCRQYGVRFFAETEVVQIVQRNGRVCAVQTPNGVIECRYAVNAAGAAAAKIARLAGTECPAVPVRHQYFVSQPIQGLAPSFPVLRVPDMGIYARVEDQGLLLGGFEADCQSWPERPTDTTALDPPFAPDADVLNSFRDRFASQLPEITGAGAVRVAKGWPTFTPDGRFVLGESSKLPGFVMACGCNAHGISGSPGLGRALLESLFSPEKSAYVRSLSPDRFDGDAVWTWQSARQQAEQLYRSYYDMSSPEGGPLPEAGDSHPGSGDNGSIRG